MSELVKRIIIAIIGIPLIFFVVLSNGIYFFLFIIIISSIALYEFYNIAKNKQQKPSAVIGIVFNLILLFLFYDSLELKLFDNLTQNIAALLIISIVLTLLQQLFSKQTNIYENFGTTFGGILYITIPMYILLFFKYGLNISYINNSYFILCILCTIWVCDISAFFIGKKIGKRKLLERVSPKKTIAGAVSGFIASVIFFLIAVRCVIPELSFLHSLFLGIIIGTVGQLGDLIESKFKRDAKVKDSSNIIPGHGGILDRFDSLIYTIPIVFIYLCLFNFIVF